MKRIVLAVFAALIVLSVTVVIWARYPKLSHPKLITDTVARANERFKTRQGGANDPEQNAYLEPNFLPYWGIRAQQKENEPAEQAVEGWTAVAYDKQGRQVDHQALLKTSDTSDYHKGRDGFQAIYPKLSEAIARDKFVVPADKISLVNETAQFANLRTVAQAQVALAYSLGAEGKTQEAQSVILDILRFGWLQQGDTMIGELIGMSIQTLALDPFQDLWSPGSKTSKEDWLKFASAFQRYAPTAEAFVNILEVELVALDQILDDMLAGKQVSGAGITTGAGTNIPFILKRERRILLNQVSQTLRDAQAGNFPGGATKQIPFSWGGWLKGETGILASVATPNYDKPAAMMTLHRAKMNGFAVACALLAFRAENGSLPENLSDLKDYGIEFNDEMPIDRFTLDPEKSLLTYHLPQIIVTVTKAEQQKLPKGSWIRVKSDGLEFQL